jgi:hypothetical protein
MKGIWKISLLLLVGTLGFFSCDLLVGEDDEKEGDNNGNNNIDSTGIIWGNEPNGTLNIANNTGKDIVIFQGQTPSQSTILGGVRAGGQKDFDISDDVSDFGIGGYMILKGITLSEYTANKSNLALAKVEYSAMATYGQDKKFRTEISPSYVGDFCFKITNKGKIGMELRKGSPDGEKIGYLPAYATSFTIYADTSNNITIFPVFVYYNRSTKTVTTVKADGFTDAVEVGPRPIKGDSIPTRILPTEDFDLDKVIANLSSPVAYVTVINNIGNSSIGFSPTGSSEIKGQSGYNSINSGERDTFEVVSSVEGEDRALTVTSFGGVYKAAAKDASDQVIKIKNGYDYTVTVTGTAKAPQAVIVEGAKRNLASEITSL